MYIYIDVLSKRLHFMDGSAFRNFMHFNFTKYFECSTFKVDEAKAIASLNIFQFHKSYILRAVDGNENCFDDRN